MRSNFVLDLAALQDCEVH